MILHPSYEYIVHKKRLEKLAYAGINMINLLRSGNHADAGQNKTQAKF
jgi:hypothetical protein